MTDAFTILEYAVIAVATASLIYGSYTDVKRRTVKALLFVPLMALGVSINFIIHVPGPFILVGVVIFLFTFLEPDTYAYAILAGIFLLVSIAFVFLIGFHWGFQILVISVVYALGFTERLFGIGDIKGIIALMFSSPLYSPAVETVLLGHLAYVEVPTSLSIMVNVAIFSVMILLYAVYLASKHGTVSIKGEPLAIRFNVELSDRYPEAFKVGEKDGTKFMTYRIPFMVAILMGYLMFLIVGSPIFL